MPKYIVNAMVQIEYNVPVEAEDESAAMQALDEWIIDDFEPYKEHAQWDFEVLVDE